MWSWLLAVIGVTGIFFVGRKSIWGWFVLLFNEVLWMAYAIYTDQYGFIFSALAYAAVYIKSYLHWKREEPENNSDYNKIYTDGDIDYQYVR